MSNKKILLASVQIIFLIFLLAFSTSHSKDKKEITNPENRITLKNYTIFGTSKGIYFWNYQSNPFLIWSGGKVKKIIKVSYGYYFLTERGIIFSSDLKTFKKRNEGLKYKVIKHFDYNRKTFTKEVQDLKDLEIDPFLGFEPISNKEIEDLEQFLCTKLPGDYKNFLIEYNGGFPPLLYN